MQPSLPVVGFAQAVGIEVGVARLAVHAPAAHDAVRFVSLSCACHAGGSSGEPLSSTSCGTGSVVSRGLVRRMCEPMGQRVAEAVARLVVVPLVVEKAIHVVAAHRGPGCSG